MHVRDKIIRYKGGYAEVYLGIYLFFRIFLPLQLPDGLFHQLCVELIADGGYMSGLRYAQNTSAAPYAQIMCCHLEP